MPIFVLSDHSTLSELKFQCRLANSKHFCLWWKDKKGFFLAYHPNSLLAWKWRLMVELKTRCPQDATRLWCFFLFLKWSRPCIHSIPWFVQSQLTFFFLRWNSLESLPLWWMTNGFGPCVTTFSYTSETGNQWWLPKISQTLRPTKNR